MGYFITPTFTKWNLFTENKGLAQLVQDSVGSEHIFECVSEEERRYYAVVGIEQEALKSFIRDFLVPPYDFTIVGSKGTLNEGVTLRCYSDSEK